MDTRLSPALVEHKARSIFGQRRHRFSALLDGSGDPGRVTLDDFEVEVVPTSCELDLRRQMADREGRAGATLYLVDWHDSDVLPRDLRARVAEGKVYRIGREERLRQVFHANRLSYELLLSPLARLAAAGQIREFPKSPKLTLDLRLAALTWLEQTIGEPFRAASPREADLLEACSRADASACRQAQDSHAEWRGWLAEVPGLIHDAVSPLASVAWLAWLHDQLSLLPACLWLVEALLQSGVGEPERKLVRAVLRRHIPGWADAALTLSMTKDGRTVDAWDRLLRGDGSEAHTQPPPGLSQWAEELDTPELLAASCRHPEGRRARETAVGQAMQALLQQRSTASAPAWQALESAAADLRTHRTTPPDSVKSLGMAQRLLAWLCTPSPPLSDAGHTQRAIALASRFAQEGGYVDWARRVMGRERPEGELGRAWEALRTAAEQKRDSEEQVFARGMQSWAAAGRPPSNCVPIENASRMLVGDFLRGGHAESPRRLLVLLMDGMSWSRCLELCDNLRLQGWEALRWRPTGFTNSAMPPMLAALPTITSVSRTAFFDGQLPESGPEPATRKDPERWANNQHIKEFEGPLGLPLFMKAEVEADRHLPSQEVLEAISNREQPLVAAIVNTLDDALKGAPSLEFTTQAIDIKPLRDLLARAEQADRAVLMVADHGHVLSHRSERISNHQEAGGVRWRVHSDTQQLHEHEVLFEHGAWSPERGRPTILLSGECAQYGHHSNHGEHGGLSLAEVVAPAVMLGTSRLFSDTGDGDLDQAPPSTPSWWSELRPSLERESPAVQASPPTRQPRIQPLFGDLGTVETESAPPRPGRSSITPAWVKQLHNSPAFKSATQLAAIPPKDLERSIRHALAACQLLVESGGRATTRALAQVTDVSLARIPGLMSRVSSILNAEGETCLRQDHGADAYVLDTQRLELVFGINLKKR